MSSLTIDTHATIKGFIAAGFSEPQAEAVTNTIVDIVDDKLVTKEHLSRELRELEYRLVIRLGSMLVVAIGVVAALVKLL